MKKYLDTVEEMIRICVRRKTVIYGILITGAVLCILKLAALDSFIIPTRFNAYGLIQRIHGIQKHEAYSVNNYNIVEIVDTFSRNHQLMPGQEEKKYDILINSYMRSGSSFTGQLLAFDPDIFYWYEPLWNYNSGVYYWGKKYVCTGRTVCGLARDKYSLNVERMQVALKHIYNCSFSTLAPAVAEKMTPFYSGKIWTTYLECRKRGCSVECCLLELEVVCKKAKHRATKVVRMTVDNLEYVLDNTRDLKVIHLIRDPRAIINSRITTTWYQLQETPVDNHQRIKLDATDTCLRIMYDLKAAEQLKVKYPTRFAIVMFEDLQNDLITKSKILYSYFGIDSTRLETKLSNMTGILAHEHTVQMKWGDYTNWWRFQLSYSAIKVIDSVCRNVTQHLGYKIFDNENDLKNISINAFSFSSELLLKNMFKSQLYDFHLNDLH